jgi:hypothetical protein
MRERKTNTTDALAARRAMGLAGLEPATSWVRSGLKVVCQRSLGLFKQS